MLKSKFCYKVITTSSDRYECVDLVTLEGDYWVMYREEYEEIQEEYRSYVAHKFGIVNINDVIPISIEEYKEKTDVL